MKYTIIGDTFQIVEIELFDSESVYCEAGSMIYMDNTVDFSTSAYGGIIRGIKRAFIKETFFMNDFHLKDGCHRGKVAFASNAMGKIIPLDVSTPHILQKKSFLCAEKGVKLDIAFTKKIGAGLFGGEGFVFQHISGKGLAFAKISGDYILLNLEKNQKILIDTGMIASFEDTVSYDVTMVKRARSILFGREGLFLATLTGPGKVYLHSFDPKKFKKDLDKNKI